MAFEGWLILAILIVMFGLLIWNKLPAWLVFMGTLTVCMTLNLAPTEGLLKGFSNSGVATVGVLVVMGIIIWFGMHQDNTLDDAGHQ